MSALPSIKKKLGKTSFNSLTRLGVDWKTLVLNNKELAKQYSDYANAKAEWVIVNIDYSQIELYCLASLSKDPDMIATVNSGKDLHSENTKKVYGIDYEDIKARLQLAKTSGNDQDVIHYQMLWDDFYAKRKFIKALSFAITYGAGSGKIAKDLRITVPEAEKLINDFYTAYPKAKEWQDRTFLHAIRDGYVETPFGRKRETPLIKGRNDAYKALVQNDARTIKDLKRNGEYWTLRDEQKQCKNTPIQSIATDMCSLAAVKVNKLFKKSNPRAKLYFWVHDSIVFHCHIDEVVDVVRQVADIMENQVKYEGDPVNYRVEAEIGFTYEYVAKLERKDIMSDNFTKELVLERLDKSLDDDINKRFNLIVKSTSTVMNDLPTYIAAMKEAKGDYFNEMVEKLGLGVNTPDEFMAHLNQTTLTEYLEATDITVDEDDDEPE
jgi:hypothetical protein